MPLTLLTGGIRSGKSQAAIRLAMAWGGPVALIATAEARDEEMAERIRRHRTGRPVEWRTVEEPVALEAALIDVAGGAFVVVDCLTLWVANLMERGLSDDHIEERAKNAASLASDKTSPSVAVTNEVGSGIVPANALARRFEDVLGRINAIWAEAADRVLLMVAGRAILLSDPMQVLESPRG
jgi:adenosylcobinamide kinase / adenosylcobinamide-phosphate guanylyltransferase